jgi:hypothetical protein
MPTGTVQFYDTSVSPARLLGQASVVNCYATLNVVLGAGSHNITASFVADANFLASGPTSAVTPTVAQASTSTSLVSSTTGPTTYGTPITFTARVSNSSGTSAVPTGAVRFYVDYNPTASTNTLLGVGTLNGSGVATLTTGNVPGGDHTVTAVYGGAANFGASTSNSVTQQVNAEGTSTSLSSSATGPVSPGTSVTFTILVSDVDSGLPAPSGYAQVFDNSTPTPTLLAMVRVTNGQATYTTSALRAGTHQIQAVFQANGNYQGSSSNVVTQAVS